MMSTHEITYEEDTVYDHLFRPSCSCGWDKAAFCGKDLAVMYAHSHLQDEDRHEFRLSTDEEEPPNKELREGMITNE